MSEFKEHYPVLLKEVIEIFCPVAGKKIIDCTFGFGGHSKELLKNGAKVLGIEWDKEVLSKSEKSQDLILENGTYTDIDLIAQKCNFKNVNGILIDLGLSSWDLEKSQRGFSFKNDEPLDMRYSLDNSLTAKEILNDFEREELIEIFRDYGELRSAQKFADQIIQFREQKSIKTTDDLKNALQNCSSKCLSLIFQALRIATNKELNNLKTVLPKAFELLEDGGILAVISFHSLEDRIVKNYFRDLKKEGKGELFSKKPITATREELAINKRSSSAKLRAIKKI